MEKGKDVVGTNLSVFKELLTKHEIVIPEEAKEILCDFVHMQADMILDEWLMSKIKN